MGWITVAFTQIRDDLEWIDTDDIQAIAEHLAQYDTGHEMDEQNRMVGEDRDEVPTFLWTTEHDVTVDGTDYVLQTCHNPWYVAMYRQALTTE